MFRNSFPVALVATVAAHTGVMAKLQTYHLTNDWKVEFDSEDCNLTVSKLVENQGTSQVRVFESNDHLL